MENKSFKESLQFLSQSHQLILETIDEIQPLLRSPVLAKIKMQALYLYLSKHFNRQDEAFLNEVKSLGQSGEISVKMVDFLVQDLKDLKVRLFIFSEQYLQGIISKKEPNFARDFKELMEDVVARLYVERNYLLPLLNVA